jgi:hypothetical protein
MSKISPFAARRPLKGIPYHDAVPSSMNMPGTNGVDRVGGCEVLGVEGAEGDLVGVGAGTGSVLGEGAEAGTVESGRRLAHPARMNAATNPNTKHMERKNGPARAVMRSVNRCTAVFGSLQ